MRQQSSKEEAATYAQALEPRPADHAQGPDPGEKPAEEERQVASPSTGHWGHWAGPSLLSPQLPIQFDDFE